MATAGARWWAVPTLLLCQHHPSRNLHGHAMQAAVLVDEREAMDTDYLAPRKTRAAARQCRVVRGIVVGRNQHGVIKNEEVGIGGRHARAIVVKSCACPG